jgi:membrane associated rhomboid family serine protease
MFLHGGFLHIGSNMLFLWIFGDNVEDRLGHLHFLVFYLLCGFGATAAHLYFNWGSPIPSIGASGAIAGVLGGYLLLFPSASIRTLLFLGPFITMTRVPAIILIGFWFVTQLFSGVASIAGGTEQTSGIAFWAHVGGFVVGLPLVLLLRQSMRAPSYAPR